MSPAEYLSSLTYKHPWAATAQAVALDMWWHHTDCRKDPTGRGEKLRKLISKPKCFPTRNRLRNSGDSRTIIQSVVNWKLYLRESIDSVSGVHTGKLQVQT